MKRFRIKTGVLVAGVGIVIATALVVAACNYHWYPYGTTYQLSRIELVSVFPAVKKKVIDPYFGEVDQWVRVCDGSDEATGLVFNVNLVGTQTDRSEEYVGDMDVAMRPGDVVKTTGKTVGAQHRFVLEEGYTIGDKDFKINIECLEPYPDNDLTGGHKCSAKYGDSNPGSVANVNPDKLRYAGFYPPDQDGFYKRRFNEDNALGVAILIDQSGSMKGYVDKDTFVEVSPNLKKAWNSSAFGLDASDGNNQRLAAVAQLMSPQVLNAKDKVIVFKYGENVGPRPKVVCYNPAGLDEDRLREECFGTNRDLVLSPPPGQALSELDKLQAEAKGRTPLWAAVKDAYQFMQCPRKDSNGRCMPTQVSHIIVISDGPDTCSPDSPHFLPVVRYRKTTDPNSEYEVQSQSACSSVGFEDVRNLILQDLSDPEKPKVHINFIQFQSKGYPERDPAQQEIACITGGQYIFLNTQYGGIPEERRDQALETVLKNAIMKVRHTLAGTWVMGIEVPSLFKSKSPNIPAGAEVAIEGTITLVQDPSKENILSLTDKVILMKVGVSYDDEELMEAGGMPNFDRRPAVRIPCTTDAQCDWYPILSDEEAKSLPPYLLMFDKCHPKVCGKYTLTCGVGLAEAGTTCTDPFKGGIEGICCGQGCFGGGQECK